MATLDDTDRLREAALTYETRAKIDALKMTVANELAPWRATPASMMKELTKGQFKDWDYVKVLSDAFVRAQSGQSPRQIWNLPSRYGKTTILKWGATWTFDRTAGRCRMIYVCYGKDLAREQSTDIRDWLEIYAADLRGQLRPDRRRHDRFVTDAGGGLLAAGFDGTIIGFGAGDGGGVLVDDPFKNWQEAHSEARRLHVVNMFKSGIRTRLDNESDFIVVAHHRMHPNDLTGELTLDTLNETGDEWEVISIPDLAWDDDERDAHDPPDPLGRMPGEPIEPERFTKEDVIARALGMGSYLASAMQQQKPRLEKGNELLREWFVLATSAELPRSPDQAITSWDLKLKDKEAGDYVVGQAWWGVGEARFLMDQMRGQYDHAATENAIALMAVRNPQCKRHIVEAAGSADEVVPELQRPIQDYVVTPEMAARLGMNDEERLKVQRIRRQGMGNIVKEPISEGKKPSRAREFITPVAEIGNVRFPADARWVPELLEEISQFPRGMYDDQVDAMSQALKILRVPPSRPGGRRAVGMIER